MEKPAPGARSARHTAGMPRETVGTVVILVLAVAFTASGMGGTHGYAFVMLFAIASVIAIVYLRIDPHVAFTAQGVALVRTRRLADGSLARVLRQGGVYQSATYLDERRFEPVFAYQRAFDVLFDAEDAMREARGHGVRRVLALGGGGYAWPKHALTQRSDLSMDVVEIDQAVIDTARRLFFVGELELLAGERLNLVCADGRAYVEAAPAGAYDAVVNDTFSGQEPVRALATVEAMHAAKACLVPGGIYLTNVVSRAEGEDLSFLRDVAATLSAVFTRVWIVPATDDDLGGEDNYIVIASDGAYGFADAIPFDEAFLGDVLHDA